MTLRNKTRRGPAARPAGLALAAALIPTLLAAATQARADYTFTTLDIPGAAPYGNSAAVGINDSGQIVGYYTNSNTYHQDGFLYTPGAGGVSNPNNYISFDDPNTDPTQFNTNPTGINNSGQISGNYYDTSGDLKGFLYSGSDLSNAANYTDIVPSATTTNQNGVIFANATGISNSGEVIGYQNGPNGTSNFIYSGGANGTYSSLNVPNSQSNSTSLGGINGSGQIVGSYTDADGNGQNFLYTPGAGGGSFSDFPNDPGDPNDPSDPPGGGTYPSGINDNGQVSGIYQANYFNHGFLYSNGAFINFEDPDASPYGYGTNAYGLNDNGDIVGIYTDANGVNQAFVATSDTASAAPEPSQVGMLALIAAGLGGLMLRARRRQKAA